MEDVRKGGEGRRGERQGEGERDRMVGGGAEVQGGDVRDREERGAAGS